MNENIDMKISGASAVPGGEYKSLRISGSGKVLGNVKCGEFRCSGAAKIEGDMEAETAGSSGSTRISGRLSCKELSNSGSLHCGNASIEEELRTSGSTKVEGRLNAGIIKSSGSLICEESIHCRQLSTSGSCKVGGDIEAEFFHSTGMLSIPGLLNAETVEIYPGSGSKIGSIGGSNIQISISNNAYSGIGAGLFRRNGFTYNTKLEVGLIEGDSVELECTRANIVRGRDVVIGKGCKIDLVEYTGTITAEEGTVNRSIKV